MSARDHTFPAIVASVLKKKLTTVLEGQRSLMSPDMLNGEKFVAVDPDHPELVLGEVLRTKPEGSAAIVDPPALTKWMAIEHPERVQTVVSLPSTNLQSAIEVLQAHAPKLLVEEVQILSWALAEVMRNTVTAREACGPEGQLDIPGVEYRPPGKGEVRVCPSKDAPAAIERMWKEGRIKLDSAGALALEASS